LNFHVTLHVLINDYTANASLTGAKLLAKISEA
jgi:hypothetical protein